MLEAYLFSCEPTGYKMDFCPTPLHKMLNGAIIIVLTIPFSVSAAEWSAEPKVSLRTGYNDNINLTLADHDSVWETALSPSVKFGIAKENQGLVGDAGFAIRRHTGGSGRESSDILDREDYHLNTSAYHNTLKDAFNASLNYSQDSTLDSELDETGIVTDDRVTRERLSLGPSWSRSLNEKTRLQLGYQFTNIDYIDDPGIPDLVGYKYHAFSTSLAYQFTPRIQGTLSAAYSRYQPDTDINSDTLSLQAGLSRNFSETLVASFSAGQRTTTSDSFFGSGFCIGADPGATFPSCTGGIPIGTGFTRGEVETSGVVFSSSVTKILETGLLSASLSRSSSPSSGGELLDATRLVLSGDYKLSETLSAYLKIGYTENETIVSQAGGPSQEKSTYFQITPRISWRWQPEWVLEGEYRYVSSERANSSEKNTRNAFYLILNYQPRKISISR